MPLILFSVNAFILSKPKIKNPQATMDRRGDWNSAMYHDKVILSVRVVFLCA